jgi:hypothetical protein
MARVAKDTRIAPIAHGSTVVNASGLRAIHTMDEAVPVIVSLRRLD